MSNVAFGALVVPEYQIVGPVNLNARFSTEAVILGSLTSVLNPMADSNSIH